MFNFFSFEGLGFESGVEAYSELVLGRIEEIGRAAMLVDRTVNGEPALEIAAQEASPTAVHDLAKSAIGILAPDTHEFSLNPEPKQSTSITPDQAAQHVYDIHDRIAGK